GRPRLDEAVIALVRFASAAEARVLTDRPRPAAVHRRVDAAGEGERPGGTQPLRRVPVVETGGVVDRINLESGLRRPLPLHDQHRICRYLGGDAEIPPGVPGCPSLPA